MTEERGVDCVDLKIARFKATADLGQRQHKVVAISCAGQLFFVTRRRRRFGVTTVFRDATWFRREKDIGYALREGERIMDGVVRTIKRNAAERAAWLQAGLTLD